MKTDNVKGIRFGGIIRIVGWNTISFVRNADGF